MTVPVISLIPFTEDRREQFILDNQWAFKHGALIEFGERDDHLDDGGEIISRATIEMCLDDPENAAYCILYEGEYAGGIIVKIDETTQHNHLEILFIHPEKHGLGIGYAAWQAIEALYPNTKVWETCTPYFEKRNIHFYVNKCGFHIVEFFHENHPDPHEEMDEQFPDEGPSEMFRFIKVMK